MPKVHGNGSIVQMDKEKAKGKCRKWKLFVYYGEKQSNGRYRRKTEHFAGTYSEAKIALRDLIDRVESDQIQSTTSITFKEYAEHYLKNRAAKKEVEPSTLKKQGDQFKAVYRHIGHLALSSITPKVIDDMYIAMLSGDTLSGRPNSGAYVGQIHDNIVLVFQYAIKNGLLVTNPCDKVDPPKSDTKPKKALTKDLSNALIARLDPSKANECAYLLAITLGLRRGEICGLRWEDVDFTQHLVHITHAMDTLGNLKGTKTKAGTRILPLPDITWKALQTRMVAQQLRFAEVNAGRRLKNKTEMLEQKPGTFVLTGEYGKFVEPGTLSRWWSQDRKTYGLENFTLHELRHTYLTLLAQSNVHPKVMQELAGHYSCQITMDIYTHVNMQAKQKAVDAVSVIFPAMKPVKSLPGVGEVDGDDNGIITVTNLLDPETQSA